MNKILKPFILIVDKILRPIWGIFSEPAVLGIISMACWIYIAIIVTINH